MAKPTARGSAPWRLLPFAALAGLAAAQAGDDRDVGDVLDVQAETTRAEQRTQAQVDALADETRELLSEYRLALQELDRVKRYNGNLAAVVADQEREKASVAAQIEDFGDLERGIVPFMLDMIDALDAFVGLDVPFLAEERRARIDRLRATMERADVSVAEKYRQIMDAYQIETAYGRTIESYAGDLEADDGARKVEFLRLGRVLLAYQTADRQDAGVYDAAAKAWMPLASAHRDDVDLGIRIAKKQAPPDILAVPVPAPRSPAAAGDQP